MSISHIDDNGNGKGNRTSKKMENNLKDQKVFCGYTTMVANYVYNVDSVHTVRTTMDDLMFIPNDCHLTSTQKVLIEDYLSTFRAIIIPPNADFKLKADIVTFDQGVAMQLEFGLIDGNDYLSNEANIIEASKFFGIDITKYSSQIKPGDSVAELTFVIVSRKILYLIKGFAPENWGNEGVKRDIAAIKGATPNL